MSPGARKTTLAPPALPVDPLMVMFWIVVGVDVPGHLRQLYQLEDGYVRGRRGGEPIRMYSKIRWESVLASDGTC